MEESKQDGTEAGEEVKESKCHKLKSIDYRLKLFLAFIGVLIGLGLMAFGLLYKIPE